MRIAVIAATGGIGRELVAQARARGDDVTAVARSVGKLAPQPPAISAKSFQADLSTIEPGALAPALRGVEAVVSALGATSAGEVGIASRGTRVTIEAMRLAQVRRLLVVSAAPIGTVPSPERPNPPKSDVGDGFWMRHFLAPLVKMAFRKTYADLAVMEDVVRASGLDWTILRPPRLVDGPVTGRYRIALGRNVRGGLRIRRADVAHAALHGITDPETIRQTMGIAT